MDDYEYSGRVPNGGGPRRSGGSIHLSFRSGSRGGGACAGSAFEYITRTGDYDGPERDQALYTKSDHMPSWAEDDPEQYWDAADLYERANGRLYVSADFALPRDLDTDEQVELAREFAAELTEEEQLPYTLAVHAGRDDDGEEHNPHAHLMFSERRNDGIERSRDEWFRRANSEHPERGGAPKSRTFHGRDWIEHARERWATLTNETLERAGRPERVDHRSYERQGIEREPGEHYGPSAAHMAGRRRGSRSGSTTRPRSLDVTRPRAARCRRADRAKLEAMRAGARLRGAEPEDEQQRDRRDRERSSEARPRRRSVTREVVMANALDEFRAQREAAERLCARLKETSALLQSIQSDVAGLVDHKALRELLQRASSLAPERAPAHAVQDVARTSRGRDRVDSGRRCGSAGPWRPPLRWRPPSLLVRATCGRAGRIKKN